MLHKKSWIGYTIVGKNSGGSMTLYNLDNIATQAMIERGFIPGFSPEIMKEISQITLPSIPLSDSKARDMRHLKWCSIDNDDSLDLDQLTFAESLGSHGFRIYVAVACVDLLVKKKDIVDDRAKNNTTSVYTPTKKFPMLPERLSNDLTSLNPDKDRLAVIFEGHLSSDGALQEHSIYLGYVHNYAKLAYDATSVWLDGGTIPKPIAAVDGLAEQVILQDAIAQKLALLRHTQGALSLETIEPQTILSNGIPVDIKPMPKNRGRLLIENFMIVANMISARFATEHSLPFIRRVVTTPKRWDKIVEIAAEHGETLPMTPDAIALEKFLVKQRKANPKAFPDISLTVIKLLGRGEYRVVAPGRNVPGHFGLAVRDYSHSTAPNRRYPDLIVQRIILSVLYQTPLPYTEKELGELAFHCTQKEDDADKVERRMRKSAAALILMNDIGKEFDRCWRKRNMDQAIFSSSRRETCKGYWVCGCRRLGSSQASSYGCFSRVHRLFVY